MRTKDQANYAANRTPENRRIYAEQQVVWFYSDLLKAQHGMFSSAAFSPRAEHFYQRGQKAIGDLAEAHASLDAITAAD
jgi:hypothetical protein